MGGRGGWEGGCKGWEGVCEGLKGGNQKRTGVKGWGRGQERRWLVLSQIVRR